MSHHVTSSPDFSIRSFETPAETEAFFRLNAQAFRPDEDTELVAAHRQRFVTDDPHFHSTQLRGAFLNRTCVGGYILFERTLCLGPSHLLTGCISGVVTHPDYRHQGIAAALMEDAIRFAESRHDALLFLHGLPGFYDQFGYTDVLEDLPRHIVSRNLFVEQSPGAYTVRAATLADAPTLLALYQRHYSSYLASFAPTRTLRYQEHLLCNWIEATEPQSLLALSSTQELHGYLMFAQRGSQSYVYEVAAETWPAALALLQAHARLFEVEGEPPQTIWWPLPPTSLTFYLLADNPPVRSELISYPNRGWMARPAHLLTLLQSLLPLWREYWQQRPRTMDWIGTLGLTIDDDRCFLEVGPIDLQLVSDPSFSPQSVRLTRQMFTQLIFGFRPLSWVMAQPGQHMPTDLLPLFEVLFPLSRAWVAGTDFF